MEEQKFANGYCAEYALALKEYYDEVGIESKINLVQLKYNIDPEDPDDFDIETAHAFVESIQNGETLYEDSYGYKTLEDIKNNSLFMNDDGELEINNADSIDDIESYLGTIEDTMLNEAKMLVKSKKNIGRSFKM